MLRKVSLGCERSLKSEVKLGRVIKAVDRVECILCSPIRTRKVCEKDRIRPAGRSYSIRIRKSAESAQRHFHVYRCTRIWTDPDRDQFPAGMIRLRPASQPPASQGRRPIARAGRPAAKDTACQPDRQFSQSCSVLEESLFSAESVQVENCLFSLAIG